MAAPQQLLTAAMEDESNPGLAYATAMLAADVAAKRGVEDVLMMDKAAKWLISNYQGLEYQRVMKGFLSKLRSNEVAQSFASYLMTLKMRRQVCTWGLFMP